MPLRIVGGVLGGRRLPSPIAPGTRPTSERVREALFGALQAHGPSWGLRPGAVLDLFAGTGALGIEALSRGYAPAWFIESVPAAVRGLEGNLRGLGLQACAEVIRADALAFLRGGGSGRPAFALALADPPYGVGGRAVLAAAGQIAPVLSVEHSAMEELPESSGNLARVWHRRYGHTALSVYAVPGAPAAGGGEGCAQPCVRAASTP